MTKADLVDSVYERLGGFSKKEAREFIDHFFNIIKDGLKKGEKIKISGFGTFTVKEKRERKGRNPRTNEEIKIPPRRVISYKSSSTLKYTLNS